MPIALLKCVFWVCLYGGIAAVAWKVFEWFAREAVGKAPPPELTKLVLFLVLFATFGGVVFCLFEHFPA